MTVRRQDPASPRFYIDYIQYLNARGVGYDYDSRLFGCYHIKGRPRPDQLVINPNYLEEEDKSTIMQCFGINPLNHMELVNKQDEGNFSFVIERAFTDPTEPRNIQQDYKNWFLNSNYICLFGHNFGTAKLAFKLRFKTKKINEDGNITDETNYFGNAFGADSNIVEIINGRTAESENGDLWIAPKNDGVTLIHFDGSTWDKLNSQEYAPMSLEILISSYDQGNDQVVSINTHTDQDPYPGHARISSLSIGRYFDLSKNANLDVRMLRTFDVNKMVTAGGYEHKEYRNRYSINPFEVFFPYDKDPIINTVYKDFDQNQIPQYQEYTWKKISNAYSKKGQRTWEMSFSYLDDSTLMPIQESSNTLLFDTTDLTLDSEYTSNDEDHALAAVTPNHMYWSDHGANFYSMVINPTLGGQLPFIFNINKNDKNPDKFCVAILDQKEFTYERVAFKSYNFSLAIKETW